MRALLARHIGPIAKIFVQKAATEARSLDEFCERLAAHVSATYRPYGISTGSARAIGGQVLIRLSRNSRLGAATAVPGVSGLFP